MNLCMLSTKDIIITVIIMTMTTSCFPKILITFDSTLSKCAEISRLCQRRHNVNGFALMYRALDSLVTLLIFDYLNKHYKQTWWCDGTFCCLLKLKLVDWMLGNGFDVAFILSLKLHTKIIKMALQHWTYHIFHNIESENKNTPSFFFFSKWSYFPIS